MLDQASNSDDTIKKKFEDFIFYIFKNHIYVFSHYFDDTFTESINASVFKWKIKSALWLLLTMVHVISTILSFHTLGLVSYK